MVEDEADDDMTLPEYNAGLDEGREEEGDVQRIVRFIRDACTKRRENVGECTARLERYWMLSVRVSGEEQRLWRV